MACFVQQVDDVGIGKSVPRPGALPDAPEAEEEEAALWGFEQAPIRTRCHVAVILPCIMTTWRQARPGPGEISHRMMSEASHD